MTKKRFKGRVPDYWWDFKHYSDGHMTLIVQTDHDKHVGGIIKEYELPKIGSAVREIDAAERLIKDLKEGRISP